VVSLDELIEFATSSKGIAACAAPPAAARVAPDLNGFGASFGNCHLSACVSPGGFMPESDIPPC
jgi:hypothetical protein